MSNWLITKYLAISESEFFWTFWWKKNLNILTLIWNEKMLFQRIRNSNFCLYYFSQYNVILQGLQNPTKWAIWLTDSLRSSYSLLLYYPTKSLFFLFPFFFLFFSLYSSYCLSDEFCRQWESCLSSFPSSLYKKDLVSENNTATFETLLRETTSLDGEHKFFSKLNLKLLLPFCFLTNNSWWEIGLLW